jgi:predicted nucleic acid-binding protein
VKRIAVIDSSALINLVHLELALQLTQFFSAVFVPREVQTEVNRKSRFRRRLNKLYSHGFYQRCFVKDPTRILTLHFLDSGEAEAITQAQELEATHLVIDEQRARKIGRGMGFQLTGTVGIIARLQKQGLAGDTHRLVAKLRRELNCRITHEVVELAIEKASEPI